MSGALPWVKAGLGVFATIVAEAVLTPAEAEMLELILAEEACDPAPCHAVREYRTFCQPRFFETPCYIHRCDA